MAWRGVAWRRGMCRGRAGLSPRPRCCSCSSSSHLQIDRFVPVAKLKCYFAVDTLYVGKKLGLLLFPFLHQV